MGVNTDGSISTPSVDPRNYQRVSDFGNNPHTPNDRDSTLIAVPPQEFGGGKRDFLTPNTPPAVDSSQSELVALLAQQNDYLQDIANYLRKQMADVLCTAVVHGASQIGPQKITDANTHQVRFEVGGKPVPIYSLLVYSSWTGQVNLAPLSLGNPNDGIPFAAGDTLQLNIPIDGGVYISSATASIATPLIINGPADPTNGGFFLYGFTIPDWDDIRNAVRSMP